MHGHEQEGEREELVQPYKIGEWSQYRQQGRRQLGAADPERVEEPQARHKDPDQIVCKLHGSRYSRF